MKKRVKVFVSAYACEPEKGSEPGVGWNWVLQLSRFFEIWVLTRKSNRQMIEKYVEKCPNKTYIHFIYFDWPKLARIWKKGMRGVRIYYNLWVKTSNHIVKKTMIENDIAVYHHLTYGNSIWGVSCYGRKQKFIWGPTGGVDTISREFSKRYKFRNRLVEDIRRLIVKSLKWNGGFIRKCRDADLILCKTMNMQKIILKKYQKKAVLFTDVASDKLIGDFICTTQKEYIEFICVGKLDAWRGMDIAIEAICQLKTLHKKVHLTILGDGNDKARLKAIERKYALDNVVTFKGFVSYYEYHKLMQRCDVVLNLALKEGAVTVSFDALSYGKPMICVDTGGYTRNLNEKVAVIIQADNYENTIKKVKNAMELFMDSELRDTYGTRAKEYSKQLSWSKKGNSIYKLFMKTVG